MSKPVYGKKAASKPLQESQDTSSMLYWLALFFTIFFLFFSAFQTALFNGESNAAYVVNSFEQPIFSALLWSSVILLFMAIFLFSKWQLKRHTDLLSILVWLIPLIYLLSSFTAASGHLASKMVLLQVMYATFFILGAYLTRNELGNSLLVHSIMACGYVVVIFGILSLLGVAYSRDAVMLTDQGLRMTSVFQYANAYAALLMALLFATVYLLIHSRSWLLTSVYSIMLVPIWLSFFLTLSRGGLVLMPIILLLLLPFLNLKKQLLFLLYLVLPAIAALAITDPMDALGNELVQRVLNTLTPDGKVSLISWLDPKVLEGWTYLLVATIGLAAIVTVLHQLLGRRLLDKSVPWLSFRFSAFVLPAAAIVIGMLGVSLLLGDSPVKNVLPDTVKERIDKINFEQHSVLERATFYKDSFKLIGDYPVLGAGGGGWAALYEKYQNNPYTSRQAHNFFLQFWIEVGTVGIVILAAFLIYVFYRYIRAYVQGDESLRTSKFVFYIVAISLLVHSTIDFEMSYAFISALVYLCLGGMAAAPSPKEQELSISKRPFVAKYRFVFPVLIGLIAVASFVSAATKFGANRSFALSLQQAGEQKSLPDIMTPLNEALKRQPHHPDYVATKVGFLTQVYSQSRDEQYYNEAVALLETAQKEETNNKVLFGQQLQLYNMKPDLEAAANLAEIGLQKFHWDNALYEQAANLNLSLYMQKQASNATAAKVHAERIVAAYEVAKQKVAHLATLPAGQMQGAAFAVTRNIALPAAQIYLAQGNAASAEEASASWISGNIDEPQTQQAIRYYLAAIMKQGRHDQPLYDKLIAKNANEKAEIDRLLHAAR